MEHGKIVIPTWDHYFVLLFPLWGGGGETRVETKYIESKDKRNGGKTSGDRNWGGKVIRK